MTLNMLPSNLPCHQYDGWCGPSPGKATLKHGFFTACGGIRELLAGRLSSREPCVARLARCAREQAPADPDPEPQG